MKMKNWILALGVACGITGLCVAADEEKSDDGKAAAAATADNEKCPVSGKDIDASKVSTYTKVVAFCCDKCKAKFEKDPSSLVEKVAAIGASHVNSKCPVSGKDVDASKTVEHNGQTVAFCCGKCKKAFKADPDKHAAKIVADHAGNDKCPVSGKAVDASKVVTFTKNVGFCCAKCQAKFDKDPDSLISKVK